MSSMGIFFFFDSLFAKWLQDLSIAGEPLLWNPTEWKERECCYATWSLFSILSEEKEAAGLTNEFV